MPTLPKPTFEQMPGAMVPCKLTWIEIRPARTFMQMIAPEINGSAMMCMVMSFSGELGEDVVIKVFHPAADGLKPGMKVRLEVTGDHTTGTGKPRDVYTLATGEVTAGESEDGESEEEDQP